MLKEPPKAYADILKKEQDELVLAYMPALRTLAFRLKERLPASIDVNDLISIGVEEMIKLSRRYDKEQNDNFWGFARKRVNGAMLDYLRTLDVMSRNDRKLIKEIDSIIHEYFLEHEDEPDDAYIASVLNLELSKVREVRNARDISYVLSLDEQKSIYNETDETNIDKIEKEELAQNISKVLSSLKEREQLVIQLYYYEELSLREISEILNVSESRISQLHKRLLKKLRERLA